MNEVFGDYDQDPVELISAQSSCEGESMDIQIFRVKCIIIVCFQPP